MPRRNNVHRMVAELLRRQYLLEYEPLFSLERDRARSSASRSTCSACRRARAFSTCRAVRVDTRTCSPRPGSTSTDSTTRPTCWRSRASAERARRSATRAATCARCPRDGRGGSTRCVNLFTSFGFFADPADDRRVIAEFARVLKPGGVLLWHGGSRDGVMARFLAPRLVADRGRHAGRARANVRRAVRAADGALGVVRASRDRVTREHRIRLYTPTRLAELCADVGLIVEAGVRGLHDRAR